MHKKTLLFLTLISLKLNSMNLINIPQLGKREKLFIPATIAGLLGIAIPDGYHELITHLFENSHLKALESFIKAPPKDFEDFSTQVKAYDYTTFFLFFDIVKGLSESEKIKTTFDNEFKVRFAKYKEEHKNLK